MHAAVDCTGAATAGWHVVETSRRPSYQTGSQALLIQLGKGAREVLGGAARRLGRLGRYVTDRSEPPPRPDAHI
ncbi:hypothetical protein GGTG_09497 [Gaeumannomyces tritici R3-111a-1]|uniref:Uncharacterized protein n=1 Tax=Gaeumannomyces tritici (strain R3-111a-1) TaxID=644352 RepID=J3P7K5_GAET3|nr:hypothetical protein GGTG_09497 [Gaeumannomyces tritici R3-111a-1]EJT72637.1 hypothetical protein GGTG_09497 [Gaeumannomyces tritici R3-111a-1]